MTFGYARSLLTLSQTMNRVSSLRSFLAVAVCLAVPACSGGVKGDPANRGDFKISLISTGQGQIYPYRVQEVDSVGVPTSTILNIESTETLQSHVSRSNGVLPVAAFPSTAILRDGSAGNHYFEMQFSHELDVRSILSDQISSLTTSSGLTTSVSLLAYNPSDESTTVLKGKGFVGGYTFYNRSGNMEFVQAVADVNGSLTVLDSEATGFPQGFNGDNLLAKTNTFVFVADSDNDLSTPETFDPLNGNLLLRVLVSNAVKDTAGHILEQEVRTATTVGTDPNPPDVIGWSSNRTLQISPGNNSTGVDPTLPILINFNKPVQPADVGEFVSRTNLTPLAGGIALNVTTAATTWSVLYYADPISYGDFTSYYVTPAYTLPGDTEVKVTVNRQSIHGLGSAELGTQVSTTFTTTTGPGVVNIPVSPDVIYVGIGGASPGLSVIDLNGYGQGTSTADPATSSFTENPNIGQPGVQPNMFPGSSALDAGSKGVFSLCEDTEGNTKLIGPPLISQIDDLHIGAPLDLVYNNTNINVNAGGANQVSITTGFIQPGNCIAVSTHPNPPKLIFPPPNAAKAIHAEEPTTAGGNNLLIMGNIPSFSQRFSSGTFWGPNPPPPSPPPPAQFLPFQSRQQIGHFLYLLDNANRQVLVLNSNRMTVIDTIRFPDPIRMSISPSLAVMAVSNLASSRISFVNIDPTSARFHTIIAETKVSTGPTEIVWQPDGEAIVVLSPASSALTIISAQNYQVTKVATGSLVDPIGVAVTERYMTTGNTSGIFYAYILNKGGTIVVYESGPDGTNGIGYNDMIGTADPFFRRPSAIKVDYNSNMGGVWVSHEDESGVAVVSHMELTASPAGPLPTAQSSGSFILPPTFRQKVWSVTRKFGGSDPSSPGRARFSGNSIGDIAFDEMYNNGANVNQITPFNSTVGFSIYGHSAKGAVMGGLAPTLPKYMFVALKDVGKIDVFDINSNTKITTIEAPGVDLLSTYWRQ